MELCGIYGPFYPRFRDCWLVFIKSGEPLVLHNFAVPECPLPAHASIGSWSVHRVSKLKIDRIPREVSRLSLALRQFPAPWLQLINLSAHGPCYERGTHYYINWHSLRLLVATSVARNSMWRVNLDDLVSEDQFKRHSKKISHWYKTWRITEDFHWIWALVLHEYTGIRTTRAMAQLGKAFYRLWVWKQVCVRIGIRSSLICVWRWNMLLAYSRAVLIHLGAF